jgi:predicted amidohydrolase
MQVSFIQSPLVWENPQANRNYFTSAIASVPVDTNLIVLPEMFTSGFTMNPKAVAESMQGETMQWLQLLAQSRNCAITGSLVITEGDQYYNRLVFVYPSGVIQSYDKKHLFTLSGEHEVYTAGTEKVVVEYMGWRICPFICYDLRFPVFSRNNVNYDLLLYVASWPKTRTNAWDILLQARAVENMCYAIGVNRIGADANGYEYIGHSQAIDYLGKALVSPNEDEGVFTTILDKDALLETRQKLNFLNDQDAFHLL